MTYIATKVDMNRLNEQSCYEGIREYRSAQGQPGECIIIIIIIIIIIQRLVCCAEGGARCNEGKV